MSITSRITSMEEHISEAYDELQGLGADLTDVNKNIENISTVLDTIYDSMPQVSGEGTSLTLDDTRVGKIKSTLKGNASQTGIPTPDTPIPVNVVSGDNTIKISDIQWEHIDGYVSLSAGNGKFSTDTDDSIYFPVIQGHTYIFNLTGNRQRSAIFDSIPTNNKYAISGTYVSDLTSPYTATATGYMVIYINTPHSQSIVDSFYVYEYGYNTYPINLPVENLFDESQLLQATDWTLDDNGYYTGIVDNYFSKFRYGFIIGTTFKANTSYTISLLSYGSGGTPRIKVKYTDNSESTLDLYSASSSLKTLTTSNSKTISLIYADYGTGSSQTLYIKDFQIEESSKTNTYTPYGTTPIELCKIGDYQDYFLHDKTLDKWYLHKEIGKYILNGSQTLNSRYTSANNTYTYSFQTAFEYKVKSNAMILSNRFVSLATVTGVADMYDSRFLLDVIGISLYYNANSPDTRAIYINSNVQLTTSWLNSNNVIIYYQLATPTQTEITYQPLIDQLNNLEKAMSKQGQTNISQVNNDLPFIISASALLDASTYINQLEAEVEALS